MKNYSFSKDAAMDYLIVGLGNPGLQYTTTRHNTGWLALDRLCEKIGVETKRLKFKATCCDAEIDGKKVLLLRPQTYMNASGESVREAAMFYRIPPEHILVLCDDTAIPCGEVRIRRSGSDGGHRGLRSIITMLGTDAFPRIRIGVSEKPPTTMDLKDWVVRDFSEEELKTASSRFDDVCEAVRLMVTDQTEKAMALCNGKRNV